MYTKVILNIDLNASHIIGQEYMKIKESWNISLLSQTMGGYHGCDEW